LFGKVLVSNTIFIKEYRGKLILKKKKEAKQKQRTKNRHGRDCILHQKEEVEHYISVSSGNQQALTHFLSSPEHKNTSKIHAQHNFHVGNDTQKNKEKLWNEILAFHQSK
jgi:hypothetical protein